MNVEKIIRDLKSSNLYAECACGEEFKLSEALIFDGAKAFPEPAEVMRRALAEELKTRTGELAKRKISADAGAEKKAIEVGIGKCLEKITPACKDFNYPLSDCRALFEPIDMLLFNGLSDGKVNSLTFLEIKTGDARLNKHQKQIKDAIEDKDVSFRWYR